MSDKTRYSTLSDAEVNAKRLAAVWKLVDWVRAGEYSGEGERILESLAAVWPEAVEE